MAGTSSISGPDSGPLATSAADHAPMLSVVVPVHNETENVKPLIDEIVAALDGQVAFEIIYVDDGSTDDTLSKLKEIARAEPRLRVLSQVNCCGQSAAIWTGVKHANAAVIGTLDGDGQNDPADMPALWQRYNDEGGGDRLMVAGLRAKRRDTFIRRLSSRVANNVRAFLLKDDTPDTGCGLKIFPREAFLTMPRFDHMHRFLAALMIRLGGRVLSVPVNHRPRERGTSKYGVWNRVWVGIVDIIGVIWLQRRGSQPDVVDVTPGQAGKTPGGHAS